MLTSAFSLHRKLWLSKAQSRSSIFLFHNGRTMMMLVFHLRLGIKTQGMVYEPSIHVEH
ncbi:hypothetical protein ACSS6W_001337 [Trichoderma asperelloides]